MQGLQVDVVADVLLSCSTRCWTDMLFVCTPAPVFGICSRGSRSRMFLLRLKAGSGCGGKDMRLA